MWALNLRFGDSQKFKGTILGVPIIRILVYIKVYIGVPSFWKNTMWSLELKKGPGCNDLPNGFRV